MEYGLLERLSSPSHFDTIDEDISDGSSHNSIDTLPPHIRQYINEELLRPTSASDVSVEERVQLQITHVTTLRSAQQKIYLVQLGHRDLQQQSSICEPSSSSLTSPMTTRATSTTLEDALRQGNNYIVIKIWTGTSRWWNCHHIDATVGTQTASTTDTDTTTTTITTTILSAKGDGETNVETNVSINDPTSYVHCTVDANNSRPSQQLQLQLLQQQQRLIAQHEIYGYTTAYNVFTSIPNEFLRSASGTTSSGAIHPIIRFPRVLYSSISDNTSKQNDNDNDDTKCSKDHAPWCILEYVGPYSLYFSAHPGIQYDTSYIDAMIPIRMEFGFHESHLRWGRLPLHLCVPYSVQLLNSFIIPLHLYYYITVHGTEIYPKELPTSQMKVNCFDSVIELVKSKFSSSIEPNMSIASDGTHSTILKDASQLLKAAIDTIEKEEIVSSTIQNLPPVLCHMDLQPQNIIFGTSRKGVPSKENCDTSTQTPLSSLACLSILDWEEAAYADPRFELLLLCRKVCANRQQADYVWQHYNDMMNEGLALYGNNHSIELGSITPWFKLEAIHSITTLLLECVAGGGRGKNDNNQHSSTGSNKCVASNNRTAILRKIQREFRRLHSLGFTFCQTDYWCIVEEECSSTM